MQQRLLGSTGLSVSRLGPRHDDLGSRHRRARGPGQLIAFVEAGGTLVDTAAGYTDGDSERLIGSLIGDVCARDEIVLATKAGISRRGRDRVTNASRGHLLSTLDASLERLGRRPRRPVAGAHLGRRRPARGDALRARPRGDDRPGAYVGVRNYTGWQSAQAATWQRAVPGRAPLASNQVEYSLLNRAVEAEVAPGRARARPGRSCPGRRWGAACSPASTAAAPPPTPARASPHFATFVGRYLGESSQRVVEAVARAADGLGWSPLEVALAWVRDRPGVTAPIVGARTAAQLRESLGVEECELPVEIVQALDDVSAQVQVVP